VDEDWLAQAVVREPPRRSCAALAAAERRLRELTEPGD